ncbi:MAG: heme-copper oxidase subunit III [Gemmatimonadales bacterium]
MSTSILPPVPRVPAAPRATASRGPERRVAETGVWIGIGTITMSFAALTSALIVRQSSGPDWRHLHLPTLLYVNTLTLVASSVTLEIARRRRGTTSVHATMLLGLLFIFGQLLAWRQVAAQNLFLSSGPSSAFFYVFTALHALHVLGGLGALGFVASRVAAGTLARSAFAATALYWHFMAVLWIYLLVLLGLRG